ncbi:MAG: O-antigen ligase family protein [Clostridium cadaveris]|uniref:O-antigen ligase family protein n=1 Tax=Clostridium cadaveris TaxID=1529 RepID=UPI002A8717D5|nr:O-antigen ligase family protein [Clostridium cadaveris]
MKIYIIAILINCIYIHINYGYVFKLGYRLGQGGEEFNANAVGINVVAALIYIYILICNKQIKYKSLSIIYVAYLIFFVLTSGSRTTLLMLLIGIFLCYLFKGDKHYIIKMLFGIVCVLMMIYFMVNIPFLYNEIGFRIQNMFNFVRDINTTNTDSSMKWRYEMIIFGIEMVRNKFMIGHGINTYRTYFGNYTGYYTYSHNTYIEILFSFGLLGFIQYFWIYFKNIKNYKNKVLKKQSISITLITLIISFSSMGYISISQQIMICLAATEIEKFNYDNIECK